MRLLLLLRRRFVASSAHDVVFFGSDHVALSTLQRLHANAQLPANDAERCVNRLGVVCPAASSISAHALLHHQRHITTAAAAAAGSAAADSAELPVKAFARQNQLPFLEKPSLQPLWPWPDLQSMISQYQVGVVVSFGYLLPAALLDSLQAGVINMHPSLLPQYRGAAPIYHALMDGRTETGVSIVTLDAHRFDAGRILWQQRVGIAPNEQYSQLAHRLAIIGADAVLDTLRHLPARLAASVPQSGKPSRAPRLSRADARVLWHTHSTAQIWHRFCALGASFGGLHTQWRGRRLKLVELAPPDDAQLLLAAAAAASSSSDASPGTVVFDRASALLLARCRDGWVGVRRVCVEGKSAVSARQFAAGYRLVGASNDAFVDE